MRVKVKLHGTLRKYLPAGSSENFVEVDLPNGATVGEAVSRLAIPPAHAKMMVSGNEQLESTAVLRDGQELNLFPPLAGGA